MTPSFSYILCCNSLTISVGEYWEHVFVVSFIKELKSFVAYYRSCNLYWIFFGCWIVKYFAKNDEEGFGQTFSLSRPSVSFFLRLRILPGIPTITQIACTYDELFLRKLVWLACIVGFIQIYKCRGRKLVMPLHLFTIRGIYLLLVVILKLWNKQ